MNLIINAGEAIGNNNGTIKVKLHNVVIADDAVEKDFSGTPIPPASYVCLTVADDGCGMDTATQNKIFEPFFTTKFTGRGLGMSAVLGIIKAHNGALQLSSTPGKGTTFNVYFPLMISPESIEDNSPTGKTVRSFETGGTILLVDDEESLRNVGSVLLKALGFSVLTASNGREALKIYCEHDREINLVFLDLIMPEMGGLEAYLKLRKLSPSVPVVICSGYSAEEIENDIRGDKLATAIQKPYNLVQLRNAIAQLLTEHSKTI